MEFTGFPADAFTFYQQLQVDNSRAFWTAHKGDYEQYVLRPIIALGEELEEEFGAASVFRPYRDIRFSADKSPHKTYQGMFVERAPGLGFYAGISADGVLASGGFHSHAPDQIERYRRAVDAESSGRALAEVASGLASDGLAVARLSRFRAHRAGTAWRAATSPRRIRIRQPNSLTSGMCVKSVSGGHGRADAQREMEPTGS